eukprot:jgi/Chrzof1/2606/Cz11g22070.t1
MAVNEQGAAANSSQQVSTPSPFKDTLNYSRFDQINDSDDDDGRVLTSCPPTLVSVPEWADTACVLLQSARQKHHIPITDAEITRLRKHFQQHPSCPTSCQDLGRLLHNALPEHKVESRAAILGSLLHLLQGMLHDKPSLCGFFSEELAADIVRCTGRRGLEGRDSELHETRAEEKKKTIADKRRHDRPRLREVMSLDGTIHMNVLEEIAAGMGMPTCISAASHKPHDACAEGRQKTIPDKHVMDPLRPKAKKNKQPQQQPAGSSSTINTTQPVAAGNADEMCSSKQVQDALRPLQDALLPDGINLMEELAANIRIPMPFHLSFTRKDSNGVVSHICSFGPDHPSDMPGLLGDDSEEPDETANEQQLGEAQANGGAAGTAGAATDAAAVQSPADKPSVAAPTVRQLKPVEVPQHVSMSAFSSHKGSGQATAHSTHAATGPCPSKLAGGGGGYDEMPELMSGDDNDDADAHVAPQIAKDVPAPTVKQTAEAKPAGAAKPSAAATPQQAKVAATTTQAATGYRYEEVNSDDEAAVCSMQEQIQQCQTLLGLDISKEQNESLRSGVGGLNAFNASTITPEGVTVYTSKTTKLSADELSAHLQTFKAARAATSHLRAGVWIPAAAAKAAPPAAKQAKHAAGAQTNDNAAAVTANSKVLAASQQQAAAKAPALPKPASDDKNGQANGLQKPAKAPAVQTTAGVASDTTAAAPHQQHANRTQLQFELPGQQHAPAASQWPCGPAGAISLLQLLMNKVQQEYVAHLTAAICAATQGDESGLQDTLQVFRDATSQPQATVDQYKSWAVAIIQEANAEIQCRQRESQHDRSEQVGGRAVGP